MRKIYLIFSCILLLINVVLCKDDQIVDPIETATFTIKERPNNILPDSLETITGYAVICVYLDTNGLFLNMKISMLKVEFNNHENLTFVNKELNKTDIKYPYLVSRFYPWLVNYSQEIKWTKGQYFKSNIISEIYFKVQFNK